MTQAKIKPSDGLIGRKTYNLSSFPYKGKSEDFYALYGHSTDRGEMGLGKIKKKIKKKIKREGDNLFGLLALGVYLRLLVTFFFLTTLFK